MGLGVTKLYFAAYREKSFPLCPAEGTRAKTKPKKANKQAKKTPEEKGQQGLGILTL